MKKDKRARVFAYYLPQFHPIPENNEWWGKGFTEWINVGKAKPLFPGHYQPHVPADLGYYDLRVPETREAQAQMAKEAGIEGFVYWHYWFGNGKQLLERPFNEVLASGKPDFPFALAWANESWSGSFHGKVKGDTLIKQEYFGDDDYINHFKYVLPAFRDARYITIDGKPIFVIYKPLQIPDAQHFIELWRKMAIDNGLPGIYFIGIANVLYDNINSKETLSKYTSLGFDGMNIINMYYCGHSFWYKIKKRVIIKGIGLPDIRRYDFNLMTDPLDTYDSVFPTVYPNWDHTPRSGKYGICVYNSTPQKWGEALRMMINRISHKDEEHRVLFVKSWNEWAEGNYLEPDRKYGHSYLDEMKKNLFR